MMKVAEIFLNTSANDAHRLLMQAEYLDSCNLFVDDEHTCEGFHFKAKEIPMY